MDVDFQPKILIVEDDKLSLLLLKNVLKNCGDILTASNGEAALELIHHSLPDIILLDIEMPVLNGFETCRRIKEDKEYNNLPILFITAHTDNDTEEKALEMGAVDFIRKPIRPAIVRSRVLAHLALKLKTDELRRMSLIDPLTKLNNRRGLRNTLELEWRRSARSETPISLLMIDTDFFKFYNDSYGHQAGDEVLIEVASVLRKIFRRAGDLVVRYGGEEFLVILPNTSGTKGVEVAELVRAQILDAGIPNEQSKVSDKLTVSIGVGTG